MLKRIKSLASLGAASIYTLPGAPGGRDKEAWVPHPIQGTPYKPSLGEPGASFQTETGWGRRAPLAGNCAV